MSVCCGGNLLVRIAALSDLHIGARDYTDGFGHDLEEFSRFLDELEDNHDRIVLLGDIYQTDHSAVPSRAAARRMLEQVRRRVPSLAERFDRPPYVHVFGNHDEIAGEALGAPEYLRVPGRFDVLFIHGHQFDPVAVRASWAADFGTWGTGRLRAWGLRPVAWWFEQRDVQIKDRKFPTPRGPRGSAGSTTSRSWSWATRTFPASPPSTGASWSTPAPVAGRERCGSRWTPSRARSRCITPKVSIVIGSRPGLPRAPRATVDWR